MGHLDGRHEFPRFCIGGFLDHLHHLLFDRVRILNSFLHTVLHHKINNYIHFCGHWKSSWDHGYESMSSTEVQSSRAKSGKN
ncbi:hypothetical protein SLEP1_g10721 [Rubroshorea leprosula]|nr:hypothetical protein SLEP1_g10721 [Rubroshorea leprosula]